MTNEELATKVRNNDDRKQCLEQLFLQNKNMIATIANKYSGFIEFDDLMQEGFFGLCKACENWDACKGSSFMNYAAYHIVQCMSRYVANNKNTVRVPEYQGHMIMKYNRLVDEHIKKTSKEPSDRYILLHLGLTMEQLKQLKKDVQALKMVSLETPISVEDESLTLESLIEDPKDQIEQLTDRIQNEQLAKELWSIVDSLEKKQADVIRERYQHNETLEGTAKKLKTTRGNVANTESMAMRELRRPKNRKRLEPYHIKDSVIYSISLGCSGRGYFMNTWTSAPERAVMIEEERQQRK